MADKRPRETEKDTSMVPEPNGLLNVDSPSTEGALRGRRALLQKHRWLTFLLPFVVFMLVGTLEPKPGEAGPSVLGLSITYAGYPIIYTLKIALTAAAIWLVLPGYRPFPLRVTRWAVPVGLVGALVWIGLCNMQLEQRLLVPLGLGQFVDSGGRSAFNPLAALHPHPMWAWGFLSVRFVGLVVVVAVAEEFFLRGFLMRLVVAPRWWNVPFGKVNLTAVAVGTLIPMLLHPAELFAAAVWFSMVTVLMVRTRSIWDCILAHAITNLLLGAYVVAFNQWHLM